MTTTPTKEEANTYIATCPECLGLMGASVRDASDPQSAYRSGRDAMTWQRKGFPVRLGECEEVRKWSGPFGHADTCSKAKKPKAKTAGKLFGATS